MRSGELPKQSIPQLSPLFLRHTNDVRHDTAVWAAQQIIHVGPSYLDHVGDLSRFGPSGLQQHVSWPKWPVCSHSTYLGSPLHKLHISGFVFFLDIVPVLGNLVQFHVIVSKLLTKRIGNLVNSVNKCLRHIIHYNRLLLSKDMASWTWVGHKSNVPKWNIFSAQNSSPLKFENCLPFACISKILYRFYCCRKAEVLSFKMIPYLWKLLVN